MSVRTAMIAGACEGTGGDEWSSARLDACLSAVEAKAGSVEGIEMVHFGPSQHKVFRLTSAIGATFLKLYGRTEHPAREREIRGNSSMAAMGCPVPEVLWTSGMLEATAFSEASGRDANASFGRLDPSVIGREIGLVLAASASQGRHRARLDGALRQGQLAAECVRYTEARCLKHHGPAMLRHFVDKLEAWTDRIEPSWCCEVTFDCTLKHYFFVGRRLSAVIDLEHWDVFDPAVEVADLLQSVQESIGDVQLRRRFCYGLVNGLGALFGDVSERLPFYIARRYLINPSTGGVSSEAISGAAEFWLRQESSTCSSAAGLSLRVEAAPSSLLGTSRAYRA
jgi:Phosphotransferase enzyme family